MLAPDKRVRVDDRVGSRHLQLHLRNHHLDARLRRLDYGDVWFEGWRKNEVVKVGVELKRVDDLIGSMLSKRLIDRQLPGMFKDYDVGYLLIEGVWRPTRWGGIEILKCRDRWSGWVPCKSSVSYAQVNRFLMTLQNFGGVQVVRVADESETAAYIVDLFRWWQKRRHKAHLGFHVRPTFDPAAVDADTVRRRLRRVADQFPHVGWFRSNDVSDYFSSIREMVNAETRDWVRIPRFGAKMAGDIVDAMKAEIER